MSTWHSKLKGTKVYHDNPNCTVGDNIQKENKLPGDGGKRLCEICKKAKKKKK